MPAIWTGWWSSTAVLLQHTKRPLREVAGAAHRGDRLHDRDGADGTSSYEIEAPNGGALMVRGNRIEKGPKTGNQETAISIGAEGVTQPDPGDRASRATASATTSRFRPRS